jgi:hypothetical protein
MRREPDGDKKGQGPKVLQSIAVGSACRLRDLASIPVIMVIRVPTNPPM